MSKLRWPVLGLAAFVAVAIAIYLTGYIGAIAAEGFETGAIAGVALVAALWLLRSVRLALIAAAVPVLTAVFVFGALTPLAIAVPSLCAVLFPHAIATVLIPATAMALVVLHGFLGEVSAGSSPDAAAASAVGRVRLPALLALGIAVLRRALLLLPDSVLRTAHVMQATDTSVLPAVVTAAFAMLVLFILLPMAMGAVRLREAAIANANRRREWRERVLSYVAIFATTRWAFAALGIAVVFGAIAVFSGTPSPILAVWRDQGLVFPATVLIAGLLGALAVRDWRAFFSCALPPPFVATVGAAASYGMHSTLWFDTDFVTLAWPGGAEVLSATTALSAGACYLVAARIAAYRVFDDPLDVAFARALSEVGLPLIAGAVVLSLALIPTPLWLLPLLGAVAALVLTPAVSVLFETVFPRFRSVEELYGRG